MGQRPWRERSERFQWAVLTVLVSRLCGIVDRVIISKDIAWLTVDVR